MIVLLLGSYIFSIKLTDKKGKAIISKEYLKIILKNKIIETRITDVIKVDFENVYTENSNLNKPLAVILKIHTNNRIIRINSSIKEEFEHRKDGRRYKTTLENAYQIICKILKKYN